MTDFVFVHDLVEDNGKTIKENNLARDHAIALKSFVEINYPDNDYHGVRAFVVEHQRDCDGTPLYGLSLDVDNCDALIEAKEHGDDWLTRMLRARIDGGWSDGSLVVLRAA